MRVLALGNCHPDCRLCQRDWLRWLAARMRQIQKPGRWGAIGTTFADAAATSIRPA